MPRELEWLKVPVMQPPIMLRSSIIYGLEDGAPVADAHTISFIDPQTGECLGQIRDVDGIAPSPQADGCGY